MPDVDVAIIGGGPSGLATAIECTKKGLSYVVVEKGSLVDAIRRFPMNMVFFTTPDLLEIGELPLVCAREKPSRYEALKYYRRASEYYRLQVKLYEKVDAVRSVNGHFKISSSYQRGQVGSPNSMTSRKLVVATGYYDNPNFLGIPGEDLPKVSHYYTEAHPYYGLDVAVIGGANSAAETALDLYRSRVKVRLIHRDSDLSTHIKYWVRPDIKNRITRGEIEAHLETRVIEIRQSELVLENKGGERFTIPNDAVLALTGYHPDYAFLESMGIQIDPDTGKPETDPETSETNVSGIYLAGGIVAGRQTNKIFIENGRFHGQKIIRHLTGH
ncbi:MAG: YpdA family putative bacillithiol disulfide reductase [Acidobacteriota bacterium]|nr:MAG: YpdA family putative bacillithiol disulfide reductase [Acidobacteriota bacterium]